jgi:dihydroxyacetone kinase
MQAPTPVLTLAPAAADAGPEAPPSDDPALAATIRAACDRLIALEDALNRLDARAGDGDTGSTAAAGARSVIAALPRLPLADPAATCRRIGDLLALSMGGSSGVLLAIFFTAAGQKLDEGAGVAEALAEGLARVRFHGGAGPGDRTLVDALAPALTALRAGGLAAAVAAAEQGAAATSDMRHARAGRAAYLGSNDLTGTPDAGAEAVAAVFRAIAGAKPPVPR